MCNLYGVVILLGFAFSPPNKFAHENYSCDQWIPSPSANVAGASGRCGPWVRSPFVSVQVNVDKRGCNIVGDAANEPSIAIDPSDPRRIAIGWRQFDSVESGFRQAGYGYSHDGGRTWLFPGALDPGVFGSDPVLAASRDGHFYYATLGTEGNRVFRSDDDGITWPVVAVLSQEPLDKPWIVVDNTNGTAQGYIYVAAAPFLARSTDRGDSYVTSLLLSSPGTPHLAIDSMGRLYYVGGQTLRLGRSDNAQDPNAEPRLASVKAVDLAGDPVYGDYPNPWGLMGQGWVATCPITNNVYILESVLTYRNDMDVMFARSADGGETWSPPIRVNDTPVQDSTYQWFGMMSVAPNGRIDAVWNDTRNSPQDAAWSELYYSYSNDGGDTWTVNIPVSQPFNTRIGWPQDYKLGDYYHMLSDNLGVNVAYAATFNGEQDIYFLRIGPHDCNANETPDDDDIAAGASEDLNANGVPDECEYRVDVDGDRLTTLYDHAQFLTCLTGPGEEANGCTLMNPNHDATIDLADFAFLQRAFAP